MASVRDLRFYTTCTPNYKAVFDIFAASFIETFGSMDHLQVLHYDFPEAIRGTHHGFQSTSWYHAMLQRFELYLGVMDAAPEGSLACFVDADIQFFPEGLRAWDDAVLARFTDPSLHTVFMAEGHDQCSVNGGFAVIRVCDATRQLYRSVRDDMRSCALLGNEHQVTTIPFADQSLLNRALRDGVCTFATIDPDFVVWADSFHDEMHVKLFHHAVATDDKIGQMDMVRRRILSRSLCVGTERPVPVGCVRMPQSLQQRLALRANALRIR